MEAKVFLPVHKMRHPLLKSCFTDEENMELKNISSSIDMQQSEAGSEAKRSTKEKQSSQDSRDECKQPWLALASYVDELTVGGRRNSKGQYIDGMGGFPGFGRNKEPKVPPDCFPPQCYQQ